jgi:hypothetical protein
LVYCIEKHLATLERSQLRWQAGSISQKNTFLVQQEDDKLTNRSISNQGCQIFSWCKIPNCQKIYQMAEELTKWPENWPNGYIICIPVSSIARPSKIYPNWDFWFENNFWQSGNPGTIQFFGNIFFLSFLSVNYYGMKLIIHANWFS